MTKKAKISISLIILACFVLTSLVLADNLSSQKIENKVSTIGVDFKVAIQAEKEKISPNKAVGYSATINNLGISSYIRFKLDTNLLSDDDFYGLNENLIKKGNYYYYTKPIDSKENVKLFEGFIVPKEITDTDTDLTVAGSYEAIQSKNFTPDFNSENPWGDVVITESTFDGENYIAKVSQNIPIEIDLAKTNTLTSEEILQNEMISGDEFENSITLKNSSNIEKKVSFVSEANEKSELLKDIDLTLINGKETIYSGKLSDANFNKDLGNIDAKENKTLTYKITLSKDADNTLTDKEDKFSFKIVSEDIAKDSAVTNDNFNLLMIITTLALSFATITIIYMVGNKKNERNK